MRPNEVRAQIDDFIRRLITASISVVQYFPSIRAGAGGACAIGRNVSASIALRDVPYEDVYRELDANTAYDVRMIDGGLLLFQYNFDKNENLDAHRLAYFPNPLLPSIDEAPALYEEDELYGDIIARRLVRFPIRFDFAPHQHTEVVHPACHLSLGQYEGCRIPVVGPLSPVSFGLFIVRNFYCRAYTRHKNTFDRKALPVRRYDTITDLEKRISHFVGGR
jgi:hypothetical protein